MKEVFITHTAKFLPNKGVSNDEMEDYLGKINGQSSKSKNIVLRSNKITNRHYSFDKDGNTTHTNAEMTALAVKKICEDFDIKKVELLAAGTSTPDQLMPSHASMVHGELETNDTIEVVSPSGVCCSSMHGLKYGFMSVGSGLKENAICTGSEGVAKKFLSDKFEDEHTKLLELEEKPIIAFEKDFLRWMLSDGASAVLLQNKPVPGAVNFKIEWIEMVSFAHQFETCMYMGGEKDEDGNLISFHEYSNQDLIEKSILSLKQDVKLLGKNVVAAGIPFLKKSMDKHGLKSEDVDYLLPHMSSEFFRPKIQESLIEHGIDIPQEKWFTNLTTVGNVGSASIFMMLDEFKENPNLKNGDKVLLLVPESARFSYAFCLLTVVK